MSDDKIAEIRARQEAGKTELSLQSEVIDSLKYLHSLDQLHDKDCDWQTQLTNVVWWALELIEKGEQFPSVAPKIWDAFIVGDFDTTLGIATDGARVLLTELIDDRATLLAEIERLTRDRDEARAEVEKLRARNARLRVQIAEYYCEQDTHPVEREE
jgi:hypothetical protein